MSILEAIAQTEREAGERLKAAHAAAREAVLAAEKRAEQRAEDLLNEAKTRAENTRRAAEEQAEQATRALLVERAEQDAELAERARANLPEAAAYIVERIEKQ